MDRIDFDDELSDADIAATGVDLAASEAAVAQLLRAIVERPEREGLRNTPRRVSRMYAELLGGYRTDPQRVVNVAVFNILTTALLVRVRSGH